VGALAECAFAFDAAALERGTRSGRHPATTDRQSGPLDGSLHGRTAARVRGADRRRYEAATRASAGAGAGYPLPATEGASHPFLSPDSRWIGFFADNKLKKVAVEGGPSVTLCDPVVDNRGGSWSQDGTILFAVGGEAPCAGSRPAAAR
jgi:hypothetical protein